MRAFVALNVPAVERSRLTDALAPLRERALAVRWVRDDGVHLTLKFLGDIESSHVPVIGDALRGVAGRHAPIDLTISGFGAFPSLRRASILWVGAEATPALRSLQRDLEDALFALGYPREQRPFRPHLTVARTTGNRSPDVSRLADTFTFQSTSRMETVDLMQSNLAAGGARYEPLLKIPLGPVKP